MPCRCPRAARPTAARPRGCRSWRSTAGSSPPRSSPRCCRPTPRSCGSPRPGGRGAPRAWPRAVGMREVEASGEVEELLDALGEAIELVVPVRVVVAHPELLAEVGERVQAVRGVGGAECVDRIQHFPPGRERSLDDEVRLDAGQTLDAHAVEHLEAERELGWLAAVIRANPDPERGVEEAEAAELLPLRTHRLAECLEEVTRRKSERRGGGDRRGRSPHHPSG